jgi:hypothetical protein
VRSSAHNEGTVERGENRSPKPRPTLRARFESWLLCLFNLAPGRRHRLRSGPPSGPRLHSAESRAALEFTQENDDSSPRCRQLSRHHVPDEIEIHTEVVVSELVSHPGHLAPWHPRRPLPQGRRHTLRGLADDLKIPDDGVLDQRRNEELVSSRLVYASALSIACSSFRERPPRPESGPADRERGSSP